MATDDFTRNTSTKGNVYLSSSASGISGSAKGNIETIGDTDWFRVSLTAGTTYTIDLEGWSKIGTIGALYDTSITGIYDSVGHIIPGCATNAGLKSEIIFTPNISQNYYISAGASGIYTGSYKLTVVSPTDDFSNNKDTHGAIPLGGSTNGHIDFVGDKDWFKVSLVKGQTYCFTLQGTGSNPISDPFIPYIYDKDGHISGDMIGGVTSYHSTSTVVVAASYTGVYFLEAASVSNYPVWSVASGTGTYKISASNRIIDDFGNTTDTKGQIVFDKLGSNYEGITGKIQYPMDDDVFAMKLIANEKYHIDIDEKTLSGGTIDYILGPEGMIPITGHNNAKNSNIDFTPKYNGVYYLQVSDLSYSTGNIQTNAYKTNVYQVTVIPDNQTEYKIWANSKADHLGFTINNCTSYVAWKINVQDHHSNFNNSTLHLGDAKNWDDVVNSSKGALNFDLIPQKGDIAQWNTLSTRGHVAYVESVSSDHTSVVLSEFNYITNQYDERTILIGVTKSPPEHYIHVN